jgi:hypothetical protein
MDYAQKIREERRTRCVSLRTKAMYLNEPQSGDPEPEFSSPCWWCLRTGDAMGPDQATAGPGFCDRPGRSCYQPPVSL